MSLSVVLASRVDRRATELVSRVRATGADCELLTPSDMTAPGWTLHPGACATSTFVVAGRRETMSSIRAAYVRLPCVTPYELSGVPPEEREYAAAEVHAFALAWLDELGPRVVNRPSPFFLAGRPPDLALAERDVGRTSPACFSGRIRLTGNDVTGSVGFEPLVPWVRGLGSHLGCRCFGLDVERGAPCAVDYWFDDDPAGARDLIGLLR